MSRLAGLLWFLAALLVLGMAVERAIQPASASSDTTVVTIDPNMPDDFLNLYPELDGDDLAELPSTGVSFTSLAPIALLVAGVVGVVVAVALTVGRRREPSD